jgi:transposase
MATSAPDRPLLNIYKAAQRLSVSEKTIRRLIRRETQTVISTLRPRSTPRVGALNRAEASF